MKNKLVLIIMAVFCIATTGLSHYSLSRVKNQIYFDVWLNQILHKNEIGKFLENKDPELGFVVETKFRINTKESLDFKMIDVGIAYKKKTKTLNIYLNAFNVGDGSYFKYSELPKSTSNKICGNIVYLLGENYVLSEGREIDTFLEYVDFINIYFTFDINDMAAGERVGGVIYKRNKKSDFFDFDFLRSFDDADFS